MGGRRESLPGKGGRDVQAALPEIPGCARVNGAQRWHRLGGISLQPSELGRIVLPIVAAVPSAMAVADAEKPADEAIRVGGDFNVKGEITAVRTGPVVTMYELEPAPGIKASRVVGLAEDIARNMSAISARVSPIPGRTVMGIELPNQDRQVVMLKELAACADFAKQYEGKLADLDAAALLKCDLNVRKHSLRSE